MSTVYIVLGMHRSGTSLVSSLLQAGGVTMCRHENCDKGTPSQPYGHWEDNGFLAINRKVLHAAGGSWKLPPSRKAIRKAMPGFAQEMRDLVKERSVDFDEWGWKDPRTTLLAARWHRAVTLERHRPRYIIAVRNEEDVAQSLLRRNGGTVSRWRGLYKKYHTELQRFIGSAACVDSMVFDFDVAKSGGHVAQVSRLAAFIGAPFSLDEMLERVRFEQ